MQIAAVHLDLRVGETEGVCSIAHSTTISVYPYALFRASVLYTRPHMVDGCQTYCSSREGTSVSTVSAATKATI